MKGRRLSVPEPCRRSASQYARRVLGNIRGAEGLIAVVFVKERIVPCGEVLACALTRHSSRILILRGCTRRAPALKAPRQLPQARGDLRDAGTGRKKQRIDAHQHEDCARPPGGEQIRQGTSHEPAHDSPCGLDRLDILKRGIALRDMHEARQGDHEPDPACDMMRQSLLSTARPEELNGKSDQCERDNHGEQTHRPGCRMMNEVPGLPGDPEPFTQSNEERGCDAHESESIAFHLRICCPPSANQ